MTEKMPFDDFFKNRLNEHESAVPQDMFDRLQTVRDSRMEEPSLKERLTAYSSAVPLDMFDRIAHTLDTRIEEPSLKDRLADFESAVPFNMFDRIADERGYRITNDDLQPSLGEKLANFESNVPNTLFDRIMAEREDRRPALAWWQTPRFRWAMAASLLLMLVSLAAYNSLKNKPTIGASGQLSNAENTPSNGKNTEGVSNAADNTISEKNETYNHISNVQSDNKNQIATTQANTIPQTPKVPQGQGSSNRQNQNAQQVFETASNSANIASNFQQQNFSTTKGTENAISNENGKQHDYNPITIFSENTNKSTLVVKPLEGLLTEGVAISSLSDKVLPAMPLLGPDNGCPTFGKSGSSPKGFYIDAYGAPEHAFRSLKALSNEYVDYRNARDTTETSRLSFSAGIRASVVFNSGFSIRVGGVFAQTNEVFRKDSAGTGDILWKIIQRPDGTRDTLSADITNGFYRQTRYNHYKSGDLTLQLGFEKSITDRLTVGINGGANINLMTNVKATILDKNLQSLVVSKSNTPYNLSVGTSLVGSVVAYWSLTDRLQVLAEPQVRYYLKPMTKNPEYQLRQSYTNVGLNIGVRYMLNQPSMRVY